MMNEEYVAKEEAGMWTQLMAWLPGSLDELWTLDTVIIILDIALIAFLCYKLLMFIRGTRGMQLLKGFVVLILFSVTSNWLQLQTVSWVLDKMWASLFVALPVVFQPELRRGLEQLGRRHFFGGSFFSFRQEDMNRLLDEVVKTAEVLSHTRTGALIVFERETGLKEYLEGAVPIDAVVTSELLNNIFIPKSPLHDGAAIISGGRLVSAGAILPLTDNPALESELGTRHRAALGVTEHTDAVTVVVSEETGVISLAEAGRLKRYLDPKHLRELLQQLLQPAESESGLRMWKRRWQRE